MRLFRNFCLKVMALAMAATSLTSCSMMSEREPDCVTEYKVKFTFRMHLRRGDEFSTQVDEVNLYVFNQAGELVWTGHEEGGALGQEGYMMNLPLPPGRYSFIAWCGQKHPETGAAKFGFAYGDEVTDMESLAKRLPRKYDGTVAYSKTDLDDLYHGKADNVELPDAYGTHVVTIDLTKDTNSIKIMLAHLNGKEISWEDFDVKITDESGLPDYINASGLLGYDNAILRDEPIEYRPWVYQQGISEIVPPTTDDNRARAVTATAMHCFTAEMATSRLQKCNRPMLTVTRKSDGERIINEDILKYFLMMRREHYSSMDDDEFLDRQDEYTMTFFLNDDDTWYKAVIDILSWRLVRQETDM